MRNDLCEHLRQVATRELLDTMMIQRWDATKLDEAICRQHMPDTDTVYLSHALGSLARLMQKANREMRWQGVKYGL